MFIKEVREHALENYDHPNEGWDYIVEAHTDKQLAELIGDATTLKQALANCRNIIEIFREQEHDVENSRW